MSTPTIDWGAVTVEIILPIHAGRDRRAPVAFTLMIDDQHIDVSDAVTTFLECPAGSGWEEILAAAITALRELECPTGAIAWAGGVDNVFESCGCAWAYRQIQIPTPTITS